MYCFFPFVFFPVGYCLDIYYCCKSNFFDSFARSNLRRRLVVALSVKFVIYGLFIEKAN